MNKCTWDPIVYQMANEVNKIGVSDYFGDLIHDGITIQQSDIGSVYLWIIKANGCGTHLMPEDLDGMSVDYWQRNGQRNIFRIRIMEIDESGNRRGMVTKI